jgi:hypothetical protein
MLTNTKTARRGQIRGVYSARSPSRDDPRARQPLTRDLSCPTRKRRRDRLCPMDQQTNTLTSHNIIASTSTNNKINTLFGVLLSSCSAGERSTFTGLFGSIRERVNHNLIRISIESARIFNFLALAYPAFLRPLSNVPPF